MSKRVTIRYKKPEWREYCFVTVDESEVDKWTTALKEQGYEVR